MVDREDLLEMVADEMARVVKQEQLDTNKKARGGWPEGGNPISGCYSVVTMMLA